MNVVLPRQARGVAFDRLIDVELNNVELERVLPSLYYLVVTHGRQRAHRPNDPRLVQEYVDRLATHPRVVGFDDLAGRRLLDRWLKAEVVRISRTGKMRVEEQIDYVVPRTLLVYKTGLPAQLSRQRNVHVFTYQTMMANLLTTLAPAHAAEELRRRFVAAFGQGLEIGDGPTFDGRHDGTTPVALDTLLAMLYLDGFEPTRTSAKEADRAVGPALPAAARAMGQDVLGYLAAYATHLPAAGLVRGLLAILNLEVFIYTMKLCYGVNSLVATGDLPPAMSTVEAPSAPELYCDFTRDRSDASDELAHACVERDVEELAHFFDSLIALRTLDRFTGMMPAMRSQLEGLEDDTPEFLRRLWGLRDHPQVEARSFMELEAIKAESADRIEDQAERESFLTEFDGVVRASPDAFTAAARAIADVQRRNVVVNLMKWYWSVGGLRLHYGVLSGNLSGRRNWRYAMGDDLLSALVQLAMVDGPDGTTRNRLRLIDFIGFLDRRFGLIVDRPPETEDTATMRAAARRNLEALKRRLRQMGYFHQLSDDFNAQYLTLPEIRSQAR